MEDPPSLLTVMPDDGLTHSHGSSQNGSNPTTTSTLAVAVSKPLIVSHRRAVTILVLVVIRDDPPLPNCQQSSDQRKQESHCVFLSKTNMVLETDPFWPLECLRIKKAYQS